VGDAREAEHEYGVSLTAWDKLPQADAIVAAVAHKEFLDRPLADFIGKVKKGGAFIDVKSAYDTKALKDAGLAVWRL
jgi:UDP-N-acetyl-D-galactosamine dehydrogenase